MREPKLKFLRQNIIYTFIQNKMGGSKELLEKINSEISEIDPNLQIGSRTLQKQIKDLKENKGWPITKNSGVFEFEENFETHVISEDERQKIDETFLILKRFIGKDGFEWLDTLDEYSFDIDLVNKIIQYEESNTGMSRYFKTFKNAIINKHVLSVKRKILRQSHEIELDVEFHPHFLKIYNNKWYVFGLKRELNESNLREVPNYVIPIDKYISQDGIKITRKKYEESDINYSKIFDDDYFSDIIGVTNFSNRRPVSVIIKIHDKARSRIIDSKPPHWSWKIFEENSEYSKATMNVKLNIELQNFLLQYTPDIEVIEPRELRTSIQEKLQLGLTRNTN